MSEEKRKTFYEYMEDIDFRPELSTRNWKLWEIWGLEEP